MSLITSKEGIAFGTMATTAPPVTVPPVTPTEMAAHRLTDDVIEALSAAEFSKEYAGTPFDYATLKLEFTKACPDFNKDPTTIGADVASTKTLCLGFAAEVLYKIAPEARKVNKNTGDRAWRLKLGESAWVFIASYKNSPPPQAMPVFRNNSLPLTMKQAGLIACTVLSRWSPIIYSINKSIVLTPLAGAIFSKDDAKEIANILYHGTTDQQVVGVMMALNASCQPGGCHLSPSMTEIALVAGYAATSGPKCDEKLRDSIMRKTTKQYMAKGKGFNIELFRRMIPYATGGLPAELSVQKLLAVYNEEKMRIRSVPRLPQSGMPSPSSSGFQ